MPDEEATRPTSQARVHLAQEGTELETFRTELRRLMGGAIVGGLVDPTMGLANVAAARTSYDQDSTGNYTQVGGDHDQVGGDYNQSASTQPNRFGSLVAERLRMLDPDL